MLPFQKASLSAGVWLFACALIGCGDSTASPDDAGGADADGNGGNGANGVGGSCCGEGGGGGTAEGGAGAAGEGGGGGGEPAPCGSFPTFEDGLTPSVEVHVAQNGSDSTGDGSDGNPFATIERAAQEATAGTSIVVHAGTYDGGGFIAGLEGSATAPIWIGGAPGEARPVLQGGDNGIALQRARYVVIHDLEITGGQANGINCDDGSDYANADAARFIVFRDLSIHDIGTGGNNDCLKLSGINDYWVLRTEFARCGGAMAGSGIDQVGCHRGVIAQNTFTEMSGNGVQCKGGSEDILVTANHFVDAGERAVNIGGSTGFEFFRPPLSTSEPNAEARNIVVTANLIERGFASLAFVGCVDCLAANNTIVDPERWPFRILQETTSEGSYTFLPASDGRVANNIIWFSAAAVTAHVNVGADTNPESFVFQNNLWFAHDDPGGSTPSLPVAESGGIVGEDPLFVEAAAGNYALEGGSPAIGAGVGLTELSGDRDGACFVDPPSIGAFEGGDP
ncbi:MAG: right-handed parallel beta-helix repeat-containing protein [Polyangiaceae bacterium]|nr:right-handed parallel beta-helix repeat-containing protein [Polyangiaceae bacterium]